MVNYLYDLEDIEKTTRLMRSSARSSPPARVTRLVRAAARDVVAAGN